MICKICNLETFEAGHFWKDHRIKQTDYYAKHEPKFDLLTQELITFKSEEQYFLADFVDKNHLKKFLAMKNKEDGIIYLINKVKQYCELKKIEYIPGQTELRTISCLPIVDTFEFFGEDSFEKVCEEFQLKTKYNYSCPPLEIRKITKIIRDTREQFFIEFPELSEKIECLKFGDYSESQKSKVVVERKSATDFRGSISKDFERFKREIQRAKAAKAYIVILVESGLNNAIYAKTRFEKVSGDFIGHRLREICREFDNCQFLFSGSREESKRLIKKILSIGECIKNYDLQYFLDKGEF